MITRLGSLRCIFLYLVLWEICFVALYGACADAAMTNVNFAHSYVCTLNFRRNKICAHPRQAFLVSISVAHEMQSKNLECPRVVFHRCWRHGCTELKCYFMGSNLGQTQSKSEYCEFFQLRPSGRIPLSVKMNVQFNDHIRKMSKLCATKSYGERNRRDYKTKATTPHYNIFP